MKRCGIIALSMIGAGIILSVVSGINRGWRPISLGRVWNWVNLPGVWNWDDWDDYWDHWGDGDIGLNGIDNIPDTLDAITGERKEYSLGSGIQNLEVEICAYYMEICPSQDGEFHVETVNESDLQCYVQNRTLYLKSTHHREHHTTMRGIRLYVPEGTVFSKVDMEMDAGELQLGALAADKAEFEIGAGELLGKGAQIGKLELSLGAGSAELKEMQISELTAGVGMGSMEFDGSIQNKGDVECGMGSVSMKVAGQETDFNYDIESAMGSVIIGTREYSGMASGTKINNQAAKKIDIDCAMGSIEIHFQE
ncbi:MAG: DUF4097 family beta strand repeat-containing protein [Lachnoclostridium sp.]|nr:DUF4097 family beta strand repeat-containing protein [Lachnospira sp.]MCM1247434.1 DUF4097 family beta strand repeat-containing protein [Lachnoclostridium sp.]MCM1536240.1 DUF4097 family beta strand repeat-containing protein [Clostridium sp.]